MQFNLRAIDLNLLPVFEAVYEEKSSSRAADRLALTQPAVSHALTRLRALFRDELFVRHSRGVRPTPVADRLYARLAAALGSVRDTVSDARGFDPATSQRSFFVGIPHPMGPMMALRLRQRLAQVAPRITMTFSTHSRPMDQERGLREGRIDAAVDWLVPAGDRFTRTPIFDDGVEVMARIGHPALRSRSPTQIAKASGVILLRSRVEGEHQVPALRELQKLRFRDVLEVSEFVEVLLVASQSDLLAPVPLSMERVARDVFGLRPVTAIARVAPIPVQLVWHSGRERDLAHAFLRRELVQAVKEAVGRAPLAA